MHAEISTQHLASENPGPTNDLVATSLDPGLKVEDIGIEKLVGLSDAFVAELCRTLTSHGSLPQEALLTLCPLPTQLTSQGIDMSQLLILYPHFMTQDDSQIISATKLALEIQTGANVSSLYHPLDTPESIAARKQTIQYSDHMVMHDGTAKEEMDEGEDQEEDKEWSSKVRRPNRNSAPTMQPRAGSYCQEYKEEREEGEEEYEEMDELQEGFDLIQQFIIQQQQQQALDLSYPPQPLSSKPRYVSSRKPPKQPKPKSYQDTAGPNNPRPVNARALALDREVLMLHEIDRPVAERMIRDKLGNNPDTSKSLRRLAMEGKVVRHGAGGRGEPFRYELTDLGKVIYRELMSTKGREGRD